MHQAKVVHILTANYRHGDAGPGAGDGGESRCRGPHYSMPSRPTDDYEYLQRDAYHFGLIYFYGHPNRRFYHLVRYGLSAILLNVLLSIHY